MADFNGTTSKAENTTAAHGITNQITILVWMFSDTLGEANVGSLIVLDEARNAFSLQMRSSTPNQLEFKWIFSGNDGEWIFPVVEGQWSAVALSLDASSVSNNPTVRVDFANATVVEVVAPTLVATAPNTGLCIGARTAGTNTWDGMIEHVQLFDRVLTAQEMDNGLNCPGTVTSGLRARYGLLTSTDLSDLSGNGFNLTGTALGNGASAAPISCGSGRLLSTSRNRLAARA